MALSSQEIDLIEQLLHVRKRKEERLQAQWNQLNEQQDICKHEKQRSYQEWLVSREALTNPLQTGDVMDRSQHAKQYYSHVQFCYSSSTSLSFSWPIISFVFWLQSSDFSSSNCSIRLCQSWTESALERSSIY